jgi:hypothetical protein
VLEEFVRHVHGRSPRVRGIRGGSRRGEDDVRGRTTRASRGAGGRAPFTMPPRLRARCSRNESGSRGVVQPV